MSNIFLSTCLFLLATQGTLIQTDKLSAQETFFLRRMTEFWKDKDFALVKKQIEEFLATHSQSSIHDNLHAILADILYQEKQYQKALELYEKISDTSLLQKTLIRKSQCQYLLERFDQVIAALTPLLNDASQTGELEIPFLVGDSLFRKLRHLENSEEQKELALSAKPLFLGLFETSYKEKVLLPLAEVHRVLEEHQQAAALYSILADKMPDKKEEILFQVASLQMGFNKNGAVETYQQIVNLGQTKASDAAYNELLLLFQENRFADLISRSDVLSSRLAEDKKPLFEFCLARSQFKLDNFVEAIVHFEKFIQEEKENTPYKRAAFLTLINCSQKTQDGALFDRTLEQFLTAFPGDEEAGKALLLHAQTELQNGHHERASADLGRLLSEFPSIPERETLLYDQALLLTKTKRWNESRQAFLAYLQEYPATPHQQSIWPSVVHCSIQELKETSPDQQLEKKAQLVSDLQQALEKSNLFTSEEKANYHFLLGQLLFDLKRYPESLAQLSSFCTNYSDHPSLAQALLLQAHIHHELQSDPVIFTDIAEKALSATTEQENKIALRLQLYNAYLALKEFDKAADHLYQCYMGDQVPVQQENELWLAHYYFESGKQGNQEHGNRAARLFQKILAADENYTLHFNPEQTY
ncbi:MAG TPA: tetratricopeptide repeat protein, partial [Candidatus Babeliaceae bacterium]|nr:tetratricopeptide repeat protein [Candidatus Babeliaceae bacterium]